MFDDRRKDTREKIALGGLVVKAGLREADRSFILGVLVSASRMNPSDPRWRELRSLGGAAFNEAAKPSDQKQAPMPDAPAES